MRIRTRRARGFSLVEMLVALVISSIVIAGAIALMLGTQRHFESTSQDRYLQETARVALGHITSNLRMAGFGVDPAVAFDFGQMANVRMDRAYGNATFSTASFTGQGTVGTCTTLCRDSSEGPDELAFISRDPSFGPHPLTVAANALSTSLTVAGKADILKGQILQVVCYTGNQTWAYVQASDAATYSSGSGTTTIPIVAGGTSFPTQNAWLADGCFSTVATMNGTVVNPTTLGSAAEVFKVDRYRYFISSYDSSGAVQPWGTANTRPFLMLDQGLQDASGPILTPLLPDVEDLQLSYVFPYDAVKPVVGATVGVDITNDDAGINLAPANGCPAFSDATAAPSRLSHHPGNLGAVRVSLVVRSSSVDITRQNSSTIPAAGNRDATAGAAGYLRELVETTIAIPNLSVQAPYYPTYLGTTATVPSGGRQLNVGGG
jgi:type IV pilus assembly protein PilW